jgi:tetratricopeptide (TPR) repeat protein
MRELLSELAPTRSVSPRVVAVFALILAVGATTAALLHVRRDDRCEHVNDVVEATWNADRANELARELAGRSTWLAEDRARFLERLDPRFDTLRSERVETCRATHVRGEQSGELLDLRMRCLEQRRRELDSLVSAVTNDADLNGSWALAALEQLPALEICGDGEALARKRLPEPEDAQLREMVAALRDRLLDVESLFAAGRYEAALELLLELRPGASAYPPASAELELRHGRLLEKLGRPADAVFALGEGLTTAQAHGHDLLVAQLTTELAFVAVAVLSKPEEGERWLALAEASTSRLGGDPDLEARQRSVRAHLQWRRGQGAESRASYRAAHDLLAAAHGEDHPSALTEALNELVVSQTTAESRDLVEKLLALLVRLEDRVGANHPEVGRALGTLATTYVRQGRHVDAVATFERAIAAYSGAGQGRHLHASMLWRNLAVSLIELERWAEAETALDESLAIATAIDPEHPAVAGAIHNLGLLRFERGDPAGAREPLERALALKLEAGGPGHPSTAVTLYLLGRVELALGEEDPAIDHLSQARVIQQRVGDPELAVTLLWLGRALAQRGHPERLRARPGADP